jgi:hypothetical protein
VSELSGSLDHARELEQQAYEAFKEGDDATLTLAHAGAGERLDELRAAGRGADPAAL